MPSGTNMDQQNQEDDDDESGDGEDGDADDENGSSDTGSQEQSNSSGLASSTSGGSGSRCSSSQVPDSSPDDSGEAGSGGDSSYFSPNENEPGTDLSTTRKGPSPPPANGNHPNGASKQGAAAPAAASPAEATSSSSYLHPEVLAVLPDLALCSFNLIASQDEEDDSSDGSGTFDMLVQCAGVLAALPEVGPAAARMMGSGDAAQLLDNLNEFVDDGMFGSPLQVIKAARAIKKLVNQVLQDRAD